LCVVEGPRVVRWWSVLCDSCGSRVFSLAARAASGWFGGRALARRFVDGRNPTERFVRLIGVNEGYAMGVVLLLGGVTIDLLPFIAVRR
jgi:hypothetical protein